MINELKRRGSFRLATWPCTLLAVAFLFVQSNKASGQCQWTSGSNTITQTCGNVGIGTTSPFSLNGNTPAGLGLHISGSGVATSIIDAGSIGAQLLMNDRSQPANSRLWRQFLTGGDIQFASMNDALTVKNNVLALTNSGNVGIGTTNPLVSLHVGPGSASPVTSGAALLVTGGGATSAVIKNSTGAEMFLYQDNNNGTFGTASTHPLGIRTNNINRIWVEAGGNVGIGTMSPSAQLHVFGNVVATGTANLTLTGTGGNAANITVTGSGSTSGNITASGTIQGGNVIAKYQDVAEWVPARRAISPGTVVILDAEQSNHVLPSNRAYDTRVAGVVSAKPGVLLGERGEGKVMVATTGRVRVKVDATLAPIRVGDLLVTSDKEGIAMRSQPLDLGGTPIHRPGTLIGKALEPLEKGIGEILVLLSLQ